LEVSPRLRERTRATTTTTKIKHFAREGDLHGEFSKDPKSAQVGVIGEMFRQVKHLAVSRPLTSRSLARAWLDGAATNEQLFAQTRRSS